MVLCNHKDFDYKHACFQAYNRWIASYCDAHPDRLLGCGQTAMRTPGRRHRRPPRHQGPRPARRDDAGAARRRGLRLAGLRRVLGGGHRSRAAAQLPHPHHASGAHAGPRHELVPVDRPRLPGHHGDARARRRVRTPPRPEGRVRRGRRRLGPALHVPHGSRLQTPPLLAAARPGAVASCRANTLPTTSTSRSRTIGRRFVSPTP